MLVISSARFEEHVTPPGHPERPARAEVMVAVARSWQRQGGTVTEPRAATREELARVHTGAYLDLIGDVSNKASMLDPDTFTSPESHQIALLAAGAAIQAVEHALTLGEPAVALVRPPGHHAESDKAMGFCVYNNAAIAAAAALHLGIRRVAIVDIDVHHGNGTQSAFYTDSRVLYISSHQYPFYPGTGGASEVGEGNGAGFTVNIPLEAGSTDGDFDLVYRDVAVPILERFEPELTLISAGFDAHAADPLAAMRMTTDGYARIIGRLKAAAARSGPLALVTEGGYDLPALRDCLQAALAVVNAEFKPAGPDATGGTIRGPRALALTKAIQRRFWPNL